MELRTIADPFVVAPPTGARVRTRLRVSDEDAEMLDTVGRHMGSLASADLARRCAEGTLDAKGRVVSRRERKREMTANCSSRWAGAITRTSENQWQLRWRNLLAERRSLQARVRAIRQRLTQPVGNGRGKTRGYASSAEHFEKRRRLQVLQARLREVEARLAAGRVSVCRGGRSLARTRHHLGDAGLSELQWRHRWEAERLFLTADGEAGKPWGNETIRFHLDERWLEIKLPGPLAHLANRPRGRFRLSGPVVFPYRGDEVAAQAQSGAVRYDICFDVDKARWYLDASWQIPARPVPTLEELRRRRVLAVDVNVGHLACWVLDRSGNPVGRPSTVPLELAGLPASTSDGRLRAAVSELLALAETSGCAALVIEDLDFAAAREEGREHHGRRPSSGRRGRRFRRQVAGIPTARFRNRLVQMAANAGLWVVAVDPAYTSKWGAEHWLDPLKEISPEATAHHAASVVIGRRGLGQRARRRARCDSTPPVDGEERATCSAGRPTATPSGVVLTEQRTRDSAPREAPGQPHQRRKTQPARRPRAPDQGDEHRSCHPEPAVSYLLPR